MAPVLSDDEKHLLSEMVKVDGQIGPGQNKAFHLVPANFDNPLPTLAHSSVPFGMSVQEGNLSALVDAGFLRRVKLHDSKPWIEVTEPGRRFARRLQAGDPEPLEDEGAQGFPVQQINIHPGGSMNTANIHGNITGSVVNMQATLTHVTQTIGAMPSGDASAKAELTQLITQLQEQLNQVPDVAPGLGDDANRVSRSVEELINEASEKEPDKPEIERRAKRLKAVAATFQAALPAVISTVEQVTSLVHRIVQ